MATALMPMANGVEEMEAVIVMDVLRRAQWTVVSAGLTPGPITASRNVRLLPDADWSSIDPMPFDVLVLPGGSAGAAALAGDKKLLDTIRLFIRTHKLVAAICAAPAVLEAAGVATGRSITAHPSVINQLTSAVRRTERVVVDGRLITSQGPGTTFEFALAIIREIDGPEKAKALAQSMLTYLPKRGDASEYRVNDRETSL